MRVPEGASRSALRGTLSAKTSAIAYRHRAAHLANPRDAVEVKELMRVIRRTIGTAPRRKKAATLEIVRRTD